MKMTNLLLDWLGKKKTPQIIRNKRGNVTTNLIEIKKFMKEHYEQLYANK